MAKLIKTNFQFPPVPFKLNEYIVVFDNPMVMVEMDPERIQQHLTNSDLYEWVSSQQTEIFLERRERLYYILKETKFINVDFHAFMENCSNIGFYKYLKSLGVYKTSGARENKTTFCNPYIWGLVAIELHPQIYAKVVVWFTDKLILNRIEAGNMYQGLSKAVATRNSGFCLEIHTWHRNSQIGILHVFQPTSVPLYPKATFPIMVNHDIYKNVTLNTFNLNIFTHGCNHWHYFRFSVKRFLLFKRSHV